MTTLKKLESFDGKKPRKISPKGKSIKSHPNIPKVDSMYYYLTDNNFIYAMKNKIQPQTMANRRYETINQARKGALAKSNSIYKQMQSRMYWGMKVDDLNLSVHVFKGDKYLGFVTTTKMENDIMKLQGMRPFKAPGTWTIGKDSQMLNADGSLGSGRMD